MHIGAPKVYTVMHAAESAPSILSDAAAAIASAAPTPWPATSTCS